MIRRLTILLLIVGCVFGDVISVTGFKNNTSNPKNDWIGEAIADNLTTDLSKVDKIKVVSRSSLKDVIKEQKFRWEIKVNDPDISRKCGVREQEAERWITTGRVGRAEIASGKSYYDFATFNIPEGSVSDISTCIIRYKLVILEEDGGVYRVEPFDVDIV